MANMAVTGLSGQGGITVDPPPTITNVQCTALSTTSLRITWDTNVDADSRIDYGTTLGGPYPNTLNNATQQQSHTFILTGLTPSTTYYFVVTSANLAGTTSSNELTCVTQAPGGGGVIDASGFTGTLVLTSSGSTYDFGGVIANRDVTICGNNITVRNLRGPGARRICRGSANCRFEDFDFTFIQISGTTGGNTTDPQWVRGLYVGNCNTPQTGSDIQINAWANQLLIRPYMEQITACGHPLLNPPDHNDTLIASHWSGSSPGVIDPTFLNCSFGPSGASLGVLVRFVDGTVTIQGCTSTKRPSAANDCMLDVVTTPGTVNLFWQGNSFDSAVCSQFMNVLPGSDCTLIPAGGGFHTISH